jgi:hypothetical protein
MSDIDLMHNGRADQTQAVKEAILGSIQFSECFRWQIYSKEELAPFIADEVHLPVIPANKLRLGTRKKMGIQSMWEGQQEVESGEFSLKRTPYYARSDLRGNKLDCELLHALFYLQLLAESCLEESGYRSLSSREQPGWQACREILIEARTLDHVIELQDSSYLRTRVRYRLKGLRASCSNLSVWQTLVESSGLSETINWLDNQDAFGAETMADELRPPSESVLVSSCRLGGDVFRMNHWQDEWIGGDEAWGIWQRFQQDSPAESILSSHPVPRLPGEITIMAASPLIPCKSGSAPSAGDGEHICFQVPFEGDTANQLLRVGEQNLSMIGCFADRESTPLCVLPFSSCSWLKGFEDNNGSHTLLQSRLNCGRLLESLPKFLEKDTGETNANLHVQFFVVTDHEH